jgi:hypothetical protein
MNAGCGEPRSSKPTMPSSPLVTLTSRSQPTYSTTATAETTFPPTHPPPWPASFTTLRPAAEHHHHHMRHYGPPMPDEAGTQTSSPPSRTSMGARRSSRCWPPRPTSAFVSFTLTLTSLSEQVLVRPVTPVPIDHKPTAAPTPLLRPVDFSAEHTPSGATRQVTSATDTTISANGFPMEAKGISNFQVTPVDQITLHLENKAKTVCTCRAAV